MPSLDKVHPELRKRIEWVMKEAGGKFWLTSTWRDPAEQQALYSRYVNSGFNPKYLAARPGTSNHEKTPAKAVDVGCTPRDEALRAELFKRASLRTPVPGEPWHAELSVVLRPLPADPVPAEPKEEEDMARYADQITWPDGAKTQVLPDGAVKCFGAPFHGSMHDLKPEQKLSFTRADAITANDPADKTKGYTIWNENGDAYRFPVS